MKTSLGEKMNMTLIDYWAPKKLDPENDVPEGESSITKVFRERREERVRLWEERGGQAVEHFYKKKGDDKTHLYIEYSTPEGKKLRSWKDCVKYLGEDPIASKTQPQAQENNSRLAIEGPKGRESKASGSARKRRAVEVSTSTDEDADEDTECELRKVSETESSDKTTSNNDGDGDSDGASEPQVDKVSNRSKDSGKRKHGNQPRKESHHKKDKELKFLEWREDAEAIPVRVRRQVHVIRKVSKKGVHSTEMDVDARKKASSGRLAETLTNAKGDVHVGLIPNLTTSKISLRSDIRGLEKLIPETNMVKPTRILPARKGPNNSTEKDGRIKKLTPRSNEHEDGKVNMHAKASPYPRVRASRRGKNSKTTETGKKSSVDMRPKEMPTPVFRSRSPPLKKRREKKKSLGANGTPNMDVHKNDSSSDSESMIEGIRKAYKVARKEVVSCKCNCSDKKSGSQPPGNHCCCLTVLVLRKCFGGRV